MLAKSRAAATTSKRAATRTSRRLAPKGRQNGRSPVPVAVMGATGTVGQRFIQLLERHPWFYVSEVMASDQSAGKSYLDAVGSRWKLTSRIPSTVAGLKV